LEEKGEVDVREGSPNYVFTSEKDRKRKVARSSGEGCRLGGWTTWASITGSSHEGRGAGQVEQREHRLKVGREIKFLTQEGRGGVGSERKTKRGFAEERLLSCKVSGKEEILPMGGTAAKERPLSRKASVGREKEKMPYLRI